MIEDFTILHFRYQQKTGRFHVVYGDLDGPFRAAWMVARGYSGRLHGLNNPEAQFQVGIGPIPRGRWFIGRPRDHASLGKYVLPLSPDLGTILGGRSGFYIHGDNGRSPGASSRGCIVLPRVARECIAAVNALFEVQLVVE